MCPRGQAVLEEYVHFTSSFIQHYDTTFAFTDMRLHLNSVSVSQTGEGRGVPEGAGSA